MNGPDRVRRAEYLIYTSGVVELIAKEIRTDKRGKKFKPEQLHLFLVGLYLSIENERRGTLCSALNVLLSEVPLDDQYRMGVRDPDSGRCHISKDTFYYLSKTITKQLGYGNSRTEQHSTRSGKASIMLEYAECERRRAAVQQITHALLSVTFVTPASGVWALDATGVWSWGKGKKKPTYDELVRCLDDPSDAEGVHGQSDMDSAATPTELTVGHGSQHELDAGWGVKTSKSGKNEVFFGFHEHTIVTVPAGDQTALDVPILIRAFELTPANRDVVKVSLGLLDRVHTGSGTNLVLVDSHYHYKAMDRWLAELRRRSWEQVHDLRTDENGFREYERMRWAAGWAHCPATPDSLGTIKKPPVMDKSPALWAEFFKSIDVRQAYAMSRHTQPDDTGKHRVVCPALVGKVGCPLRKGSEVLAVKKGLPVIADAPDGVEEELPKCCTQETVLVRPPEPFAKLGQRLYWGSREWFAEYKKRSYVEGVFGNVKHGSTENLRRGLFHITGLPLVHLMMAMVNVSYNLRMMENWVKKNLEDEHNPRQVLDPQHPLLVNDSSVVGYRTVTHVEEYGDNAFHHPSEEAVAP